MGAGTDRVTHVVQAVEEADQVVGAIERRCGCGLEADPVGKAGIGGPLTGRVDRALVSIEADDVGGRVGLGEQQGRCAVAAADVGDPGAGGQLGLYAIERGDPCAGEVVEVAGPEEALAAAEDVGIVGAPGEPGSGAEPLGDRVCGVNGADGDLEAPITQAGLVSSVSGMACSSGRENRPAPS
jgi:hypothetical protein